MKFEDWLEQEFPSHSEYDFNSDLEYQSWLHDLKRAYTSGWDNGCRMCYPDADFSYDYIYYK